MGKQNCKHILNVAFLMIYFGAQTQTLAMEQFDSLPGTLNGYEGSGTGWFGDWQNQGGNTGPNGYRIDGSLAMTHPEVNSAGNYCVGGGDFTSTGRFLDAITTFDDYSDTEGRIGQGTLYFSFLIRKDGDNDTPIEIILADSNIPWHINEELIKIGYFGTSSNFGGDRYWSLAAFNETAISLSDSAISIGETYQIIIEIDFDVTTVVNMWVNPENGSPDLSTPDATVSSTEDLGFWSVILFFNDTGTGHGSFDEFIFSSDLSTVLPVEYSLLHAYSEDLSAVIRWTTEIEINNEKFIVQRSANGEHWKAIGEVMGNGNSNMPNNYRFLDVDPIIGSSFYRLVQVDYNGAREISKSLRVEHFPHHEPALHVSLDQEKIIFFSSSPIEEIVLIDMQGRVHRHEVDGKNRFSIVPPFGSSMYLVIVHTEQGAIRKKYFFR